MYPTFECSHTIHPLLNSFLLFKKIFKEKCLSTCFSRRVESEALFITSVDQLIVNSYRVHDHVVIFVDTEFVFVL